MYEIAAYHLIIFWEGLFHTLDASVQSTSGIPCKDSIFGLNILVKAVSRVLLRTFVVSCRSSWPIMI